MIKQLQENARAYKTSTDPVTKEVYFELMQRLRGELGMTAAGGGDGDGDGDKAAAGDGDGKGDEAATGDGDGDDAAAGDGDEAADSDDATE